MNLVEAHGVCKSYAARTVLRELTLEIPEGQFVAIMGESGSGKSTLLHLLGGLDQPDRGSLTVAGRDLSKLGGADLARFRREVTGLVFQSFHLLPSLSVRDNVELPLRLRGARVDARRIDELLGKAGIGDLQARLPEQLSGGEQQRCALVRALAGGPHLLLADEPTGSLDKKTGDQVLRLLRDLARDEGATVVMVTHSQRAARVADRIVELEDGRLLHMGADDGGHAADGHA